MQCATIFVYQEVSKALSSESSKADQGKYKIKTVAELTGFSATLLRAWERRYGFLSPSRVSGKHRLYTETDLKVLYKVKEHLALGRSIGEVAILGRIELLGARPQPPLKAVPPADSRSIPERTRETLLGLAPTDLRRLRRQRWRGDGLGVSLRELVPLDLAILLRLYRSVHGFYELWLYTRDQPLPELLGEKLAEFRDPDFVSQIHQLGAHTAARDLLTVSALEAARWGALPLLLRRASELGEELPGLEELRDCAFLARDHAKMLRNAFYDLDATLTAADSSPKAHGLDSVMNKLRHLHGEGSKVEVCCEFHGGVTSRCLETAALDRVLYDLLHRTGEPQALECEVWALALRPDLLRIAFSSPHVIRPYHPEELPTLAIGLAMGVEPQKALDEGYLGVTQSQGQYWGWFHWPTYDPPAGVHLCNCEP